jgi:protein O-GlcNAc transferase
MTDETLALWARILRESPDARLRLQDKHLDYPEMRDRLRRRLAEAGVAAERVTIHGRSPRDEYLARYGDVDIILDTTPFSGGTTTCEAIWMGVPTVTLAGQTLVTRQGASIMTCVGLEDWVAGDEDGYVSAALRHAADVAGLAALRNTLRTRALASPLFDADRFAGQLEDALHEMWRAKLGTPFAR